jgi:hypothetical protein
MSDDKTITVRSGMDTVTVCFILFYNFGDSKYDLYDAIMIWLMK